MPAQPEQAEPQQRQIRVFISSTFRDMHGEREELVKKVFPQLRKLCEQRGVIWSDVDLRWGVTDEQKAEGHALPICLAEIERCRPYFIGLLGERYGPPVDKIHPDMLAREPWLNDHLDRSLTEMEILQGALRNPAMAEHAFFYFRDAAYVDRLPEGTNPADFRSENADRAERLRQLKAHIRTSGFPVQENYADPKALGQLVLKDFTALINRLYPEGSQPSPLDREAMDQDFYAASRRRVYIRRQGYFDVLDRHATGQGRPLVVVGESGIGKSALLANWALEYRKRYPEELILLHFIGATPYSSDWAHMVRRIMGEFGRRLGVEEKIPDQPEALGPAFINALYKAGAKGRMVLVLDAVNQLEDREGAQDLAWLPPELPTNVRLILSTLPGRSLEEVKRRVWQMLPVQPFSESERRQLIHEYLWQYAKDLKQEQVERIAGRKQTANPLYLRILLEELRLFGEHEELESRIIYYLSAPTIPELYDRVLARYEEDYEADRPGLVRDTMTAIWAARRGLSEGELLDIASIDRRPVVQAAWSPLYLGAEESLASRSGLISFAHRYFREAVKHRYLITAGDIELAHKALAQYFQHRNGFSCREFDELPWQLTEAHDWDRLSELLTSPAFLKVAWRLGQSEVLRYWAKLETSSPRRKLDAFGAVLDKPLTDPELSWITAHILAKTGHSTEALRLRQYLSDHFAQEGDSVRLAFTLDEMAQLIEAQGDPDKAIVIRGEAERMFRSLDLQVGLAQVLANQAASLTAKGNLDGALDLNSEAERIYRSEGLSKDLATTLSNHATILAQRGEFDQAMALHKEAEHIHRTHGDLDGLAIGLSNQALIFQARGEFDIALSLHKEAESMYQLLGDDRKIAASLNNQGLLLYARGGFGVALALYKRAQEICLTVGDRPGLAMTLGNEATIRHASGDHHAAIQLHVREEQIFRAMGMQIGVADSLNNQAVILCELRDTDSAMHLHREAERVFRTAGAKEKLAASLNNQGLIFADRGELDRAMAAHKEAEELTRSVGNREELARTLGNQANIMHLQRDYDRALALHKEEERIFRELRVPAGLVRSLDNQARIAMATGDLQKALSHAQDALRVASEFGLNEDAARMHAAVATVTEAIRTAPGLAQRSSRASDTHGLKDLSPVAQPEIKRLDRMRQWAALPWWKKLRVKRPER